MRAHRPRLAILLVAAGALAIAAPAHAQGDPTDPWEPMNRRFFAIQEGLDRHIIAPIAHGFGATPGPLRTGLRNFSRNLGEPLVFVNDMLQARLGQAAKTLTRFVVNSTIGIGGLFDVAGHNHVEHHDNGFGTTLGRWGFGPGPYLFLPLVGPSDLRDAFGSAADTGLNPLTYARYPHKAAISIGTTIIDGLNRRVEADQDLSTIRQTSTDPYATLRSFYLQDREKEVTGKGVTIENLPSFDEPTPTPPTPPAPGAAPPQPEAAPTPTPQAEAAKPGPCAPAAVRWAQADLPYATWRDAD